MLLTSGLLVGILAVIAGLILFVRTRRKSLAIAIVAIGFTLSLVAVVSIVFAISSWSDEGGSSRITVTPRQTPPTANRRR